MPVRAEKCLSLPTEVVLQWQQKERNKTEQAGHIIPKTHDPPNQPIIIANLFHTWILLGLTRNTRMKSAQHKRRHNLGTVRKGTARVGD
jgi:hypothetical protein